MNSKIVKIDVKWLKNFKNLLIYLKFLETKPLSKLNEETMAKKQKSPSSSASASEHAPLLDSAATRLVKRVDMMGTQDPISWSQDWCV